VFQRKSLQGKQGKVVDEGEDNDIDEKPAERHFAHVRRGQGLMVLYRLGEVEENNAHPCQADAGRCMYAQGIIKSIYRNPRKESQDKQQHFRRIQGQQQNKKDIGKYRHHIIITDVLEQKHLCQYQDHEAGDIFEQ